MMPPVLMLFGALTAMAMPQAGGGARFLTTVSRHGVLPGCAQSAFSATSGFTRVARRAGT